MSEPTVTTDDVEHVAALARVALDEGEPGEFAEQFSEVLEYFDTLDEVPEVDRETELVNVLREDEVEDGLSQEDALANAPESEDGKFKGPRVS
ncbi:aspartyl-tRNA(Asn)/glutamyl-tRNA(Gln) amidotransferase subunit C [Halalkaliarchaeum desulfuricum]|uniref:Aspartyl/glutamyl-tRNA(Asn/Gln) amidotransferase subunit C n=1 Tax=Halalkaliarchaeum desulfuricum TaxID=2055893 RepID=A0A343TMC8_9EURY|nr:Asp-tRNA(Asn)/Glu-tRNA(Gln) amidotransferase subunit GatC [Halalkaliarchaeum desulfuricum]AUX10250.1 aspartyl-tRNA(Asn)/glutamyl-tRNA(Gln) amidotransferase subunit C [Halalkaliarchaeum desulfuricum]